MIVKHKSGPFKIRTIMGGPFPTAPPPPHPPPAPPRRLRPCKSYTSTCTNRTIR